MTQKVRFKKLAQFGFGPNVMKKTKVCPECGQVTGSRVHFCPGCGQKMPRETLFDRYKQQHTCCPDCDTVLAADSQYCPGCGKQILPKAVGNGKNTP